MKSIKILIIGAGIAGLAAANELNQFGYDVTILEARNRIGGRIWNDDQLGVMLSKGAFWLHGIQGNPLASLADHFHLKKLPLDLTKNLIFNYQGKQINNTLSNKFSDQFDILLKETKQFAFQSENDVSLKNALTHFFNSNILSENDQIFFQQRLRFFENFYGIGYEELSGRYWDQENTLLGGHHLLIDTYETIIQSLAKYEQIKFNTVVTDITEINNGINVIANDEKFYADAILITVPLGVLKNNCINFTPPLPVDKQLAINHLGMGLLNAIVLKFPRFFWPNDKMLIFLPSKDKLPISTFFNLGYALDQPFILAYTGGDVGKALEDLSDKELINIIMQQFKRYFSQNIPEPENFFITRWLQDPFSKGSYSYLPVGATPEDYDKLAKPATKRIFFAGEATHQQFPATTHGAYLSGMREAERIRNLYG